MQIFPSIFHAERPVPPGHPSYPRRGKKRLRLNAAGTLVNVVAVFGHVVSVVVGVVIAVGSLSRRGGDRRGHGGGCRCGTVIKKMWIRTDTIRSIDSARSIPRDRL